MLFSNIHMPDARYLLRVLSRRMTPYLNQLVPVSSMSGRRHLRSSFTLQLHVPQYPLSTAGRRSFPVAASIFWNTLPDDVQSAPSVSSFRRQLKTILVSPVVSWHFSLNLCTIHSRELCKSLGCFSHDKNFRLTFLTDIDDSTRLDRWEINNDKV